MCSPFPHVNNGDALRTKYSTILPDASTKIGFIFKRQIFHLPSPYGWCWEEYCPIIAMQCYSSMSMELTLIKMSALCFRNTRNVKWPFRAIQMGTVAAKMTCALLHMCLFIHLTKCSFSMVFRQIWTITQAVFETRSPLCGADSLLSLSLRPSNLTGTGKTAYVYQK